MLHSDLINQTYTHGPYQPFTIFDPKQRSIHKAIVRDRLVHQALVSAIEPYFEKQFIFDSYSCRLNKGTHAGVARLQSFLQKASVNNTKTVYALKCDVRKFFDSVDHQILVRQLEKKIIDGSTLDLVKHIIASFQLSNAGLPYASHIPLVSSSGLTRGSSVELDSRLRSSPKNSSRGGASLSDEALSASESNDGNDEARGGSVNDGKGLPLGNVTSQLFANVYLHELDFFVKHNLKMKYYLRYCDDFIILHHDRQFLVEMIDTLRGFLKNELLLELHPNKVTINTYHQGIDFLGYVLKPGTVLLRHKTKQRLLLRSNKKNIASYLGVCSHASSHVLQKILISKVNST